MEKKITEKFIEARKNKNNLMKSLYESLRAKILVAEKSGDYEVPLSDSVVLNIIKREIKERKETKEFYKPGDEMYENLTLQIAELMVYMPQEMSADEVCAIIKKEAETMISSNSLNKGKLIGMTIKQTGDRFDKSKIGPLVTEVLKELGV
jgi:uncharacterized protein YqeY